MSSKRAKALNHHGKVWMNSKTNEWKAYLKIRRHQQIGTTCDYDICEKKNNLVRHLFENLIKFDLV